MKVTVNHEKIAKSLSYISKAVSQKPNIPVLSNVLFLGEKTGVMLSATNLDMSLQMWIPAKVDEEGSTTISAKYFADFVSATVGDNVDIILNDNVVNVKTKFSKASFNTIAAQEFPVLPKAKGSPLFSIDTVEFIKSLEKVSFACSTDISAGKIQQSGILFEFDKEVNDKITFVGLDSFRLSKRDAKIEGLDKEFQKTEIIVPAKYLSELSRILLDNPKLDKIDVFLSETKSQIIFKVEDLEFSVRLIEGPYPDYKRILPDSFSYSFEVKKPEFEKSIKVVNTFARSNLGNKTFFDFDVEKSILNLKSAVAEVGENETSMEIERADGASDLNTAYNLRYLQDLVSHVEGDTIRFETKGPLAASVFKDKSDPTFMHLIMPLRREA